MTRQRGVVTDQAAVALALARARATGRQAHVVDLLIGLARRPIELVTDPELLRPIDLPVLRGDASKLRAATGWGPEIPIEQTVADLLDDMRARVAAEPAP